MLAFPNAKINLGLYITGKRTDGFHDLESLLLPVAFRDILEIIPSRDPAVMLQHSGLSIPGKEVDNLCLRAYHLLKQEFGIPTVKMHLHKVIPVGAGLGGGSSDAAFAIKLLNELFSLRLTASQMTERAGRLGSDCAFFIEGKPVFASGKGDQLQPAEMNLSGYTVVILVPPVQISTAEAYKLVEAKKPSENIRTVLSASPREWKDLLVNDFEGPVFRQFPEIRKLKEKLYNDGALYASMTGSGSAVYGLFDRQLPAPGTFAGCTAWTGKLI